MKGLEALMNTEHMTDNELGEHAEQLHQDLSLLQHQQRTAVAANAVSLEWCDACGNEIPELRRAAIKGVTLCVECQREEDRRARLYR